MADDIASAGAGLRSAAGAEPVPGSAAAAPVAANRLLELIRQAAEPPPPPRKRTRPTLASKKRRLEGKVRRGGIKAMRGRPSSED